jgi:hypothetical protein
MQYRDQGGVQNIRIESGTFMYSSAREGSNQYIFGVAAGRSAQAPGFNRNFNVVELYFEWFIMKLNICFEHCVLEWCTRLSIEF